VAPLFSTQVAGPISLRSLAIASGELPQPSEGPKLDANLLEAAFREVQLSTLQTVASALQGARDELKGLGEAFQKGAGGQPGPDLSALDRIVFQAQAALRPRLAARSAEAAPAKAGGAPASAALPGNGATAGNGAADAGGSAHVPEAQGITGVVRSRDDVVMLLDKIIGYYERHEPSSPLPMLLSRCRKLAALSFLDIVKDLAPAALQQIELIGGIVKEKAEPAKK
jgi:type VI secretion system protein ImpA